MIKIKLFVLLIMFCIFLNLGKSISLGQSTLRKKLIWGHVNYSQICIEKLTSMLLSYIYEQKELFMNLSKEKEALMEVANYINNCRDANNPMNHTEDDVLEGRLFKNVALVTLGIYLNDYRWIKSKKSENKELKELWAILGSKLIYVFPERDMKRLFLAALNAFTALNPKEMNEINDWYKDPHHNVGLGEECPYWIIKPENIQSAAFETKFNQLDKSETICNSADKRGNQRDFSKDKRGDSEAANLLKEIGMTVGCDSLFDAAYRGEKRTVSLLLDAGVNPNCEESRHNFSVIGALIDGANDKNMADYIEILKMLIERGLDINKEYNTSIFKTIPLIHSIVGNKSEIAKLLISSGANINKKSSLGITPLIAAMDNREIADILLDKGADVNLRDNYGRSALMYAVSNNKNQHMLPIIEKLILKGADVNAKDFQGNSPLNLAKGNGFKEAVILLRQYGAK